MSREQHYINQIFKKGYEIVIEIMPKGIQITLWREINIHVIWQNDELAKTTLEALKQAIKFIKMEGI